MIFSVGIDASYQCLIDKGRNDDALCSAKVVLYFAKAKILLEQIGIEVIILKRTAHIKSINVLNVFGKSLYLLGFVLTYI